MKKILIIDDNTEFKELICDYFRELGYIVEETENGSAGVKLALSSKPDIIFLDVMMPEKSGIEVLRELQTYPETLPIPVIVITGTYFEKNMHELFRQEINCKDFLSKTTELSVIQKKVEELLS